MIGLLQCFILENDVIWLRPYHSIATRGPAGACIATDLRQCCMFTQPRPFHVFDRQGMGNSKLQ